MTRVLPNDADDIILARLNPWDEPAVTNEPFVNVTAEPYGAIGDGVADDTAAIQAAVEAAGSGTTYFPPNLTYLISDTIDVVDDYARLYGPGAVIKLSNSPVGGFDTTCRVFDCQDVTGVKVSDLVFREPASEVSYSALDFGAGIIRLHDSVACEVSGCRFEFDGFATGQTNYLNVVWVEGTAAADNRITGNYCLGAAIEYAYNGPSRTLVHGNSVLNSPYNGISGHCDSNAGADHRVIDNHVVSPARMGIEDYGSLMVRTVIRGNTISNTGAGYDETVSFGISAVSTDAIVDGNHITDFESYGIEAVADNQHITNNVITQDAVGHVTTGTGIIVNSTTDVSRHIVSCNTVTGCDKAIHLYDWGDCVVSGNCIVDPTSKGIEAASNASTTVSTVISGNVFRITAPATVLRQLVSLLYQSGDGDCSYVVDGNSFVFDAAADGGADYEFVAVLAGNNAVFSNNVIDGGGVTYSATPPYVTANGTTPDGVHIIGNRFIGGADLVTNGMTTLVNVGNTGITLPDIVGDWSDGTAGPAIAALLETMGLVTDSTTA